MGSTGFRNPRALGFRNPVDPLVSVSNSYIYTIKINKFTWGMCINQFSDDNDIVTLREGEGKGPDMEMYVLCYHG